MSWDIYGNPLRRGHCEVHPHVHEEYPCSICTAERNRPQINRHAHEEFERLQHDLSQQGDYIRHLESERAALVAQNEALMKIVQDNALVHISANTAKIGADAVEPVILDSYDAGHLSDFGGGNVGWWQDYIRSELAKAHGFYQSQVQQYADSIRRGEVNYDHIHN